MKGVKGVQGVRACKVSVQGLRACVLEVCVRARRVCKVFCVHARHACVQGVRAFKVCVKVCVREGREGRRVCVQGLRARCTCVRAEGVRACMACVQGLRACMLGARARCAYMQAVREGVRT